MITQEFLQSCTDEQINRGVAWLQAKSAIINSYGNWWHSVGEPNIIYKGSFSNHFQPCVWPNDIMPIAFANRIGVTPRGVDNKWKAYSWTHETINTNPLRAICEVYILMEANK
tara:strand:- start:374 stop:712 length:339 start_codon:yes stop_codon:yes gene_type:complete